MKRWRQKTLDRDCDGVSSVRVWQILYKILHCEHHHRRCWVSRDSHSIHRHHATILMIVVHLFSRWNYRNSSERVENFASFQIPWQIIDNVSCSKSIAQIQREGLSCIGITNLNLNSRHTLYCSFNSLWRSDNRKYKTFYLLVYFGCGHFRQLRAVGSQWLSIIGEGHSK